MALVNLLGDLALAQKQEVIITSLSAILTELAQKLETGQAIALDSVTLAALESITTTIANFPSDYPDAAVLAKVEAVRVLLAATLTISGTVNATVLNFPGTQPVSAVSLPLPSGAATSANQQTNALTDTQLRASAVPISGPLTDTQLRATPVPVSGTVTSTGGLTNAELRATPVPISGTAAVSNMIPAVETGLATQATLALIKAKTDNIDVALSTRTKPADTQTVSGAVSVSNFPSSQSVTGPLTDTQLRASLVPVKDEYPGGEVLAQQSGAGAVLTFTFSAAVQLVVVESAGALLVSRADPFGGTPSVSLGIPARDEVPTYLPVITTMVKVFAPAGAVVNCWGYRR